MFKEKETYKKLEKIGEGTYGVVYKAKEVKTGKIVALKKIKIEGKEGIPPTTLREIALLKNLRHTNIVTILDTFFTKNKFYMALEFLDTDLRKFIDETRSNNQRIPELQIQKIIHQILSALDYCHSKSIMHRDIKPQNILIDKNFNVKLADFGLSRSTSIPLRTFTQEVITLWYRPPELILNSKYYSEAVDVWSTGAIFCELKTLVPLFAGDSEIEQLAKIFKIFGTPTNKTWSSFNSLMESFGTSFDYQEGVGLNRIIDDKSFVGFVKDFFIFCPEKRITIKKALGSEYLK